ncbi:MAG: DUF1573 domain-containing protein [Bacteroidia bacterium]
MRLKAIFFTLLLNAFALGLIAQAPAKDLIEFTELTHEFGTVDQGAPTETVFQFKNISSEKIYLNSVKAGCGCTTPSWSKDTIGPGKTGEIRVSYNSQRVGAFHKSVTVNYNNRPSPITLYIKGDVKGKEGAEPNIHEPDPKIAVQPSSGRTYNQPRGGLSFESTIANIKTVTSEEEIEVEYHYKNTSSLAIKIRKDLLAADSQLVYLFKDLELAPGQESMLKVRLSGKQMRKIGQVDGYFNKPVVFYTDEASGGKKELAINGSFKRIYTEAEKAASPRIVFEATAVEGGKIIEGENYVHDFTFRNTGNSPLKIISAKASCGCTVIKPITEEIAPGEMGAITATFDSKQRVGMQSKTINVVTNDIENPQIPLRFTVEVVKDPFHAGNGGMGGGQ